MANPYGDDNSAGSGEIAGLGGVLGAIPFLNVIAPGITSGLANQREEQIRKEAIDRIDQVRTPQYSNAAYQDGGYSGDFTPEKYADPIAAQYQTISEDPRVRGLQMQALQRLQKYGDQAADSQESLGRYNAMSDGNAVAAQREAAIRNQMQMRGQGGSGAEFAMQQIAAQEGANRAQSGGLNSAMQAALQRLQGTNAAFGAAAGMRGQDLQVNGRNADIINAFNMHNTNALNAARAANTGLANGAQMRNLDARQNWGNNRATAFNAGLDRNDRNQTNTFSTQIQKAGLAANALGALGQQAGQSGRDGNAAGQQGFGNLKSLMGGFAGGM
jgi:hypothetical protein